MKFHRGTIKMVVYIIKMGNFTMEIGITKNSQMDMVDLFIIRESSLKEIGKMGNIMAKENLKCSEDSIMSENGSRAS